MELHTLVFNYCAVRIDDIGGEREACMGMIKSDLHSLHILHGTWVYAELTN